MKTNILVIIILISHLGCNYSKIENKTVASIIKSESKEDFVTFFNSFRNDTIFQKARIDNPLPIESMDDESNDEKYTVSKEENVKVSFSQKDWKDKIEIIIKNVTLDTTLVSLKGKDTGLWIEHYFADRKGKWFLFKIRDLSD